MLIISFRFQFGEDQITSFKVMGKNVLADQQVTSATLTKSRSKLFQAIFLHIVSISPSNVHVATEFGCNLQNSLGLGNRNGRHFARTILYEVICPC